jgi:hypothetical protein
MADNRYVSDRGMDLIFWISLEMTGIDIRNYSGGSLEDCRNVCSYFPNRD